MRVEAADTYMYFGIYYKTIVDVSDTTVISTDQAAYKIGISRDTTNPVNIACDDSAIQYRTVILTC